MTNTQAQLRRLEAMKRQRERLRLAPPVKEVTPEIPYVPPVDARPGRPVGKRVLLKDALGRYIEL